MKPQERRAITYQLEKIDSGGELTDMIEGWMERVAKDFGFAIEEDALSMHYGMIKLPNGQHAGIKWEAYIE